MSMLKRLKAQVTQVANDLPELLGQQRESSDGDSTEKEGFLCPVCMKTFPSPEELSLHFPTHSEGSSGVDNPNYANDSVQVADVVAVDAANPKSPAAADTNDAHELRQQLQEERWYSAELKKELERIQTALAASTDVPTGEVPYLMQQIQMLEAGKSLVTQRLLECEKETGTLRRAAETASKERKEVMGKLKEQSVVLRNMTDELEQSKVEKELAAKEARAEKARVADMDKLMQELSKTLDQRPSEDDVAVLRKELINAQTLMDEIAREKEQEINEHLSTIRHLNMEREKQHCMVENLQKKVAESGSEQMSVVEEVATLRSQLEEAAREREKLEKRLAEREAELQNMCDRTTGLEETARLSTRHIEESTQLNEQNMNKLGELTDKLEQISEEKKRKEMDLAEAEERTHTQTEQISKLELQVLDLTNELASMGSLLESERTLLATKGEELETRQRKMDQLRDECDTQEKEKKKAEESMEEKVKLIESLTREVQHVKENAEGLMQKAAEGEGGAKLAIDQLTHEKANLAEELKQLAIASKEQKEEASKKWEECEKKYKETERGLEEKMRKLEQQLEEKSRRLREAEEECNRKAELFVEMEREAEEERAKTNERVEKLKEQMKQREQANAELRRQVEEACAQLADREAVLREKERMEEESRVKIEESVQRLKRAEEQARQMEADLHAGRSANSELEQQLRAELTALEKEKEQLMARVEQTNERVRVAEEETEKMREAEKQREEHWKGRQTEWERQLGENQEANEELLAQVDSLNKNIAELDKEKTALQVDVAECHVKLDEASSQLSDTERTLQMRADELDAFAAEVARVSASKDEAGKSADQWKQKFEDEAALVKSLETQLVDARLKTEDIEKSLNGKLASAESKAMDAAERERMLKEELDGKKEELAARSVVVERLEAEVAGKVAEIDDFHARLAKFEEEAGVQLRNIEQLEQSVGEEKERAEKAEQRVQVLEVAETELCAKKTHVEQLQSKCTQFEHMAGEVREQMQRQLEEKERLLEQAASDADEYRTAAIEREKQMQVELSRLSRTLESTAAECREKEQKAVDAEKAMQMLTEQNMELQKRVGSWEEERNALIERCLNTESDLDFERERAAENKRRFDDALSAMHELGRANQSLQMDISKQTNRKWLDDSAAVNCTQCGTNFSLRVRKHHCRVCGLIYCNPCSNKTAQIASHKDPVRVCGGCYTDIMNR